MEEQKMNKIFELKNKINGLNAQAKSMIESEDFDSDAVEQKLSEIETLKSKITALEKLEDYTLPNVEDKPNEPNAFENGSTEPDKSKSFHTIYQMKFGNSEPEKDVVFGDLVGRDYKEKIWEQEKAFNMYLRFGVEHLSSDQVKLLKQQIFPYSTIKQMVKLGYEMSEIKATMVEAQGSLGGYAVPMQRQDEIIARLPGMTAVRGNGATVINLDTGNGVELLKYGTGGNDQYMSAIRGQWGSETQTPTSQNSNVGLVQVSADVYTYKVPMSQSLVEDATNLVNIVTDDITQTLALDEDDAFLVGDGVGKPLGILPGGTNGLSLSEVNSGSASTITSDGLIDLRRAVPSQYRQMGATWIANDATWGVIEKLKVDGSTGEYRFPDLMNSQTLMRSATAESESMPDVAGSAYPMIYGNLSGYYIVERAGLTIQRFQDSNTGPNKVEFHVRRRVGGRVVKPWMLAVMTISS